MPSLDGRLALRSTRPERSVAGDGAVLAAVALEPARVHLDPRLEAHFACRRLSRSPRCSSCTRSGAWRIRNWRDKKPKRAPLASKGSSAPALLAVRVRSENPRAAGAMEVVVLAGGRRVRVGGDFDASALGRLITTLEGLAC